MFAEGEGMTEEEAKFNCQLDAERKDHDEVVEPNRINTHKDADGIWHATYITGNY